MPVSTRPLVVVHGISIGGNAANAGYSRPILDGLDHFVADRPHDYDFHAYEALWADEAQGFVDLDAVRAAETALAAAWGGPIALGVLSALRLFGLPTGADVVDLVADVIAYSGERRAAIRAPVRRLVEAHHGCVLMGHSMGSVIAIDLLSDLIEEGRFKGPREDWPISAVLTAGSPLGIDVPGLHGIGYTDRAARLDRLDVPEGFVWRDYLDLDDPVASGSLWRDARADQLEFFSGYNKLGVNSVRVDTGSLFTAHTRYWGHRMVIEAILDLITRRYR